MWKGATWFLTYSDGDGALVTMPWYKDEKDEGVVDACLLSCSHERRRGQPSVVDLNVGRRGLEGFTVVEVRPGLSCGYGGREKRKVHQKKRKARPYRVHNGASPRGVCLT
jgi:hypothetical protein